MTDFATDQSAIDKKQSRVATDRQINDLIIRTLMARQDGRRWVWLRLSECHIFEQTNGFGEDAVLRSYFAAGERNIGLKLLADVIRLCPAEYIMAMQEAGKMETGNDRRSRRGGGNGGDSGSDPDSDNGDDAPSIN